MERYYKKQCLNHFPNIPDSPPLPSNIPGSPTPPLNIPSSHPSSIPGSAQQSEVTELDEILVNLPADPGLRHRMLDYPLKYREAIHRYYLQNEPCQPKSHIMPRKASENRCFITVEVMSSPKRVYKLEERTRKFFKSMREMLEVFIIKLCNKLKTQKQHIETFVIKQTDEARVNYHTLQSGALDCTRWLLRQGLAFRGHNESLKSSNKGNYMKLMQFLADHNEKVRKVVFENAPKNLKYISSNIQKDLVHACAIETINAITKDMKEQMAVVLRYVNKRGEAIEKFLGVQHVSSTTSSSFEDAIKRLFATTNLSMSMLRGQSYNGASNMRGELNGLKTKILNKYPQAFYIHCFAHQLQLALVFVAKENEDVANFFINASSLVNLIGSSCMCCDAFREKQQEQIQKALDVSNLETGKRLNQESSLMHPCDTRWNLHYDTIVSIIVMFEAVVEVVEWTKNDRK
ncbi:zinc finger MYM-type protein 1-like [Pyrus x bretschneideri]|uniref:zinc finger MYM-type protein 1-like n=1 Tax=Pyrus x bretschneideri TaxID=225117 RepID=UPI00202F6534|nr:zinc finger MYM-type protein 1-like [Pyrus x bretschneideri]